MAIEKSHLCFVAIFFFLFTSSTCQLSTWSNQKDIPAPTWCVASWKATDDQLQRFIDFACQSIDCKYIQPGGTCYEPNTLKGHGSYCLDVYYRINKVCDPANGGAIVYQDPSYGNCLYI